MKITPCDNPKVLSPCTLEGLNYQIDPYVGCQHYCYYCYALNQAETNWQEEILIHGDIAGQLESELVGMEPQTIYMGWQTDPYQPCEIQHRQTRQVLELLLRKGFSASILTKSDLVLRDMDLLQEMDSPWVSFSLAFNDNATRRLFEANTMDNEKRIGAMGQLKNAGIRTGALLCPVVPYITDPVQLIDMVEALADVIWVYGLGMEDRSGVNWLNMERIINRHFPDLLDRIEPVIFSKKHMYWAQLRDRLETLKNNGSLNLNIGL